MSINPENELHLLRMKKRKIKELMAIPDMTEEIDGGDFFDDENLVHTEEKMVEGVQILSTRDPAQVQYDQNSGNPLQGSSELMNFDYTQQEPMPQHHNNEAYPTNSQMHGFHNSRPNPNMQNQPYSGINYNMMGNNQQPNQYY